MSVIKGEDGLYEMVKEVSKGLSNTNIEMNQVTNIKYRSCFKRTLKFIQKKFVWLYLCNVKSHVYTTVYNTIATSSGLSSTQRAERNKVLHLLEQNEHFTDVHDNLRQTWNDLLSNYP